MSESFDDARKTVEMHGYVVLKRTSYRNAQERQRIAEALLKNEQEHTASIERWARDAFAAERKLAQRCSYLYGLAKAHGATDDELHEKTEGQA